MSVTVYTKPSCVQCRATRRALDRLDIPYQVVDLTLDEEALALVRALGHQQAPVVLAGGEHWSGFQPDRIRELVTPASVAA